MTSRALLLLVTLGLGGCPSRGVSGDGDVVDLGGPNVGGPPSTLCGRPQPTYDPADFLARARYGMVATWRGSATIPDGWVPAGPYAVEVTFAADGTFQAHTLDSSGGLPFYYDSDPESGRWELTDQTTGIASGNLYLAWLPTTPDAIDHVELDSQQVALSFDFTHDGHGPVHYSLTCK